MNIYKTTKGGQLSLTLKKNIFYILCIIYQGLLILQVVVYKINIVKRFFLNLHSERRSWWHTFKLTYTKLHNLSTDKLCCLGLSFLYQKFKLSCFYNRNTYRIQVFHWGLFFIIRPWDRKMHQWTNSSDLRI